MCGKIAALALPTRRALAPWLRRERAIAMRVNIDLRRVLRRALQLLGVLAVLACAVPAVQCVALRYATPPITLTMLGQCGAVWPERGDVALAELPAHVPLVFVSSEDQRFYAHHGFDWEAIAIAWDANQAGGKVRGASTISQQVARNAFLWQGRSWVRKGLETWYTLWLELIVPKDRILEVYLSIAQTGPCVFGVEAGARHWFGRPAPKLTRDQAATLAAMLPAPARWTPSSRVVRRRAAWILAHPAPMTQEAAARHPLPRR